jgi:hypothetical protein
MRLKLRFLRPREDESARAETVVTAHTSVYSYAIETLHDVSYKIQLTSYNWRLETRLRYGASGGGGRGTRAPVRAPASRALRPPAPR